MKSFIAIVIVSSVAAFYLIGWLGTITPAEYRWTDCVKVTEVQAVGHKYSTSYFITGENGNVQETRNPQAVGSTYCFSKVETKAQNIKNFFTWWRQ